MLSKEVFEFSGFEWDDEKAENNWRKHGIDFEEAKFVFDGPLAALPQFEGGENRWCCIGAIESIEIVVIFTERDYEDGTYCRLISARRANGKERKQYYQIFYR